MALNLKDIKFENGIPDLPKTGIAVHCKAPNFDERQRGMHALAKHLDLGETREVDTQFGRAMASKSGDVEFFAASGAIWSTNIAHELKAESEFIDWDDLDESKDAEGQPILSLGRKATSQAFDLATQMAEIGGFDLKHADKPAVKLMQVEQANEKGRTMRTGAGEATVAFGYQLDGLPVLGAGGKTLVDMIPGSRGMKATSAINVWRTPQKQAKVEIAGTEAGLAAGLLQDPDLMIAAEKGAQITIQRARLGLVAMPAAIHQSILFPALEYDARVDMRDKGDHYFVGRVVPVATPEAYAKAGLASEHFGLGMK